MIQYFIGGNLWEDTLAFALVGRGECILFREIVKNHADTFTNHFRTITIHF